MLEVAVFSSIVGSESTVGAEVIPCISFSTIVIPLVGSGFIVIGFWKHVVHTE